MSSLKSQGGGDAKEGGEEPDAITLASKEHLIQVLCCIKNVNRCSDLVRSVPVLVSPSPPPSPTRALLFFL